MKISITFAFFLTTFIDALKVTSVEMRSRDTWTSYLDVTRETYRELIWPVRIHEMKIFFYDSAYETKSWGKTHVLFIPSPLIAPQTTFLLDTFVDELKDALVEARLKLTKDQHTGLFMLDMNHVDLAFYVGKKVRENVVYRVAVESPTGGYELLENIALRAQQSNLNAFLWAGYPVREHEIIGGEASTSGLSPAEKQDLDKKQEDKKQPETNFDSKKIKKKRWRDKLKFWKS